MKVIGYVRLLHKSEHGLTWVLTSDQAVVTEVVQDALGVTATATPITQSENPSDFWIEVDGRKVRGKMGPTGVCDINGFRGSQEYLLTMQAK